MPPLRLILDLPAEGSWNMAADEMLLERADRTGEATLRFYTWRKPTLSLGYFQRHADRELHAASRDCALVRRASGGGAILHDRELTYSFSFRDAEGAVGGSRETYDTFHETIVEALRELGLVATQVPDVRHSEPIGISLAPPAKSESESLKGSSQKTIPFLCFQHHTPGDVLIGNDKVVGSAQRRHRGALLQHGSVLLGRSSCAPELAGISDHAGREISAPRMLDAWLPRLKVWLATLVPAQHSAAELDAIDALRVERFLADSWTLRR